MKYNKWDPYEVQMERGNPVMYNKADTRITAWDAERRFHAAVRTMQTWATRAFRVSAANPDPELREYDLERFGWELDRIETWLGAMRLALAEQSAERREQEKIDKLLALAESSTFPEEADTARRKAIPTTNAERRVVAQHVAQRLIHDMDKDFPKR